MKGDEFMRGFGVCLASIWHLHHDGQMVRHLISANGFTLTCFRDVCDPYDYEAISSAVKPALRSPAQFARAASKGGAK